MEKGFVERFKDKNMETKADLVLAEFDKGASEYWGKVHKREIFSSRTNSKGVEYFMIIADFQRGESKSKLLQEWFINKKGEAQVTRNKVTINDDLCDELALKLCERWGETKSKGGYNNEIER